MRISIAAILLSISLQGCASVVDGATQSLSVEAKAPGGTQITGASCQLTNDKGKWFVATPGRVFVHRSYSDLVSRCTKDGFETADIATPSGTKPLVAGNILIGGLIGTGVDVATGAAYDYPRLISVMMTPAASIPGPGVHGVTRRELLVRAATVTPSLAATLHLDSPPGVVLLDVSAGGAAASAGLLENDVILTFNGQPITGT